MIMPRPPAPPGGRPRAIAALLLSAFFFLLIGCGATMVFIGAHDLYVADRPIKCGGEVMNPDGPYTCFTGHGPRNYSDLVRERRAGQDRAPYMLAFGALAVVIGVPALRRALRYVGRVQRWTTSGEWTE
ncbi:hypothetical protein ETD96_23455 [Actinomadura geliboluensis]|uniref:Uncharacterized protein n=2 Tax=Actinomadura geliboluensis TaxID=882440 RepID=A0A5S4GRF0_9ACTN|nr:hypothetical protein ETD96_23455 [Actinomadura geliboluensis]